MQITDLLDRVDYKIVHNTNNHINLCSQRYCSTGMALTLASQNMFLYTMWSKWVFGISKYTSDLNCAMFNGLYIVKYWPLLNLVVSSEKIIIVKNSYITSYHTRPRVIYKNYQSAHTKAAINKKYYSNTLW